MTQYRIEIHSDDPINTADVLDTLSAQIRLGATETMGALFGGEVLWNLRTTEFTYAHGDYVDGEGNLLHIHEDVVSHVTWAKTADQEDVEIPVEDWMEAHGTITDAS